MAVLFDALVLDGPRSGVEVSVAEAGRALVEAVGASRDLAPEDLTFACRGSLPAMEEWLEGARVMRAPAWAVGRPGRILAEQLWLPRAGRGHAVLHGPAYVLPLGWRGASVVTVYDLVALAHPQWAKRSNALHYGFVLPRSVRKADMVVVPSRVVREEVVELLGVPEERIRVLPLGVREVFREPPGPGEVEEFRARFGLDRPFFAVVGNIEPKKNIAATVRAFEIAALRLPHELVIAGRKGWRCERDLAAVEGSPVRDRIRLVGRPSDGDLRCLYHACTALVQWSLYEGFGLVPLEAMACGAAVVVSTGGALPETAGPGARRVPLDDPAELAEALVILAQDESTRRTLVADGLRWSRQFTWRAHAEALLSIYRDLA